MSAPIPSNQTPLPGGIAGTIIPGVSPSKAAPGEAKLEKIRNSLQLASDEQLVIMSQLKTLTSIMDSYKQKLTTLTSKEVTEHNKRIKELTAAMLSKTEEIRLLTEDQTRLIDLQLSQQTSSTKSAELAEAKHRLKELDDLKKLLGVIKDKTNLSKDQIEELLDSNQSIHVSVSANPKGKASTSSSTSTSLTKPKPNKLAPLERGIQDVGRALAPIDQGIKDVGLALVPIDQGIRDVQQSVIDLEDALKDPDMAIQMEEGYFDVIQLKPKKADTQAFALTMMHVGKNGIPSADEKMIVTLDNDELREKGIDPANQEAVIEEIRKITNGFYRGKQALLEAKDRVRGKVVSRQRDLTLVNDIISGKLKL